MSVTLKSVDAVRSFGKTHKKNYRPINTDLADALLKLDGHPVIIEFKERKRLMKDVIHLTKDVFNRLDRSYVIGAMYKRLDVIQWHSDLHRLIRDIKNALISSGSYVRAYEELTGMTCKKVPSVVYRNMAMYHDEINHRRYVQRSN